MTHPESAPAEEPSDGRTLTPLTDLELSILDLERTWFKYAGVKELEIRKRFDWSSTRYYQRLRELLEREEALAADPLLVKRLRRLQVDRARSRQRRRLDD